MNKVLGSVRILAATALLAAALLVLVAPLRAATPVAAPGVLELGKGPTIVIVHDLGGNRMSWLPTARKLIGKHRVVLVDLPGHSGSALPSPFTLEAAAEALDLVLAKQNPDSTVLVGKGTGATLALLTLKAHPGRVRGLVAIDAGLKSPIQIDDQFIKYFNEQMEENYDAIVKGIYTRMGRDSAQGVDIHAMVAQTPPVTMKAYVGSLLTSDTSPALKSLTVPFLLITTDRVFYDGWYATPTAKEKDWPTVAKTLGYDDPAAVSMRRLKGAGYFVMKEQPDSLAAILSEFTAQALAKKK